MTTPDFTPYSTGAGLFGLKPSWVSDPLNQQRLQSYELYEKMYWNLEGVFQLSQRGTNDKPIYIPSSRTIVDTSNRFTGTGYGISITSATNPGEDTSDVLASRLALSDFLARERFKSKFQGAKRFCQIQGDWVWHITADPLKPVGSRISINTVDPSYYFPIADEESIDKTVGVMLAQQVTLNDSPAVRRVFYRKMPATAAGPGGVTVEEGIFEVDTWEDPEATPVVVVRNITQLPPEITSIPVYHVKNFEEPGNMFGSSELRGMEILAAKINQTISDEDLTLALQGLGMYRTTAGQPVDPETKKPVPWQLGPGRVVHHPEGTAWDRVAGVGTVAPFGDHYDRLWTGMKQGTSSPDVAIGTVDVQIAQSGIALALQLLPIRTKANEKNDLIAEAHNQMWYDVLNMWYPAFEETTFTDIRATSTFSDAVPVDRDTRFRELNEMLLNGVIDDEYYRNEAAKMGYVFPDDMEERAAAWRASQKAVDPFAARVDEELDSGGDS